LKHSLFLLPGFISKVGKNVGFARFFGEGLREHGFLVLIFSRKMWGFMPAFMAFCPLLFTTWALIFGLTEPFVALQPTLPTFFYTFIEKIIKKYIKS